MSWSYSFDRAPDRSAAELKALMGGKGANLLDATRLGIPVPPGFTVTTEGCNDYLAAGEEFPGSSWEQVLAAVSALEEQTGKSIRLQTESLYLQDQFDVVLM